MASASPTQFKVYLKKRAKGARKKMLAQFANHTDAINYAYEKSRGTYLRVGYSLTALFDGIVFARFESGKIVVCNPPQRKGGQ